MIHVNRIHIVLAIFFSCNIKLSCSNNVEPMFAQSHKNLSEKSSGEKPTHVQQRLFSSFK